MNATQLFRAIAPDIGDLPFYDIYSDDLPAELALRTHTHGMFCVHNDLALKSHLEATGQWAGRGLCIMTNRAAITADICERVLDDEVLAAELIETKVLGVKFHELAHGLEQPIDISDEDDIFTPPAPVAHKRLAKWCAAPPPRVVVPWDLHDCRFVRVLAHVLYRAERLLGERIPCNTAFESHGYGLTSMLAYQATLLNECETLADASFQEIRSTPPPAAFVQLWRSDVRAYVADLRSVGDILTATLDGLTLYHQVSK